MSFLPYSWPISKLKSSGGVDSNHRGLYMEGWEELNSLISKQALLLYVVEAH